MKKIVALLMASAMAASLAACGGSAQSSEATSTAPAESTAAESTATDGKKYEGVELTMWSMWSAGEVQANAIQAAADAFEAETGAHVNIEWKRPRCQHPDFCRAGIWRKTGHLRG